MYIETYYNTILLPACLPDPAQSLYPLLFACRSTISRKRPTACLPVCKNCIKQLLLQALAVATSSIYYETLIMMMSIAMLLLRHAEVLPLLLLTKLMITYAQHQRNCYCCCFTSVNPTAPASAITPTPTANAATAATVDEVVTIATAG
jgi:hypothetical protein